MMYLITKITLGLVCVGLLSSNASYNLKPINSNKIEEKAKNADTKADNELVIYNWEDYIDPELIDEFEEEYNCTVKYYTFDTNETMYNLVKLQPEGTYDLINASDYMLQKMVREGMLDTLNVEEECPEYYKYASSQITGKLKIMPVDANNDGDYEGSLYDYAAGYMWGTLGIVYDPECSETIDEDVKSWNIFWDSKYEDLISIKNSMRDTIVVGVMHAYENLETLKNSNDLDENEKIFIKAIEKASADANGDKNEAVQNVFDLLLREKENSKAILEGIKRELISLKENIFGFEVDSGKNDIITGKIKMNLAWSGDAIFSIDTALDEEDKVLKYSVPESGSNVWYDGWALPKKANRELACAFIDFISRPENASRNMDYIGYTTFIGCDEVFDLVSEWYGVSEYSEYSNYHGAYAYIDEDNSENSYTYVDESIVKYGGKYYRASTLTDNTYELKDEETDEIINVYSIVDDFSQELDEKISFKGISPEDTNYWEEIDAEDAGINEEIAYDLSYIFDNQNTKRESYVIYPYEGSENELEAQYPSEEILSRCAIMKDFEDTNDAVIIMWGQLRAYTNMLPYYIILSVVVGAALVLGVCMAIKKRSSIRNRRKSLK